MSWSLYVTVRFRGVTFYHLGSASASPMPLPILCQPVVTSVPLQNPGWFSHMCSSNAAAHSFEYGQLPWVSGSGQRFPLLDTTPCPGKNNSLMPQSSFIVWDDSESGEAYCLDVFVVHIHCCGMWGFPPLRVFLDLCVNSRELCIMLCSVGSTGEVRAHVWESVSLLMWSQRGCLSDCVLEAVRYISWTIMAL